MNSGRTAFPSGASVNPTIRQFIGDLHAEILEVTYGYTVTLPSTLNTAHASLDSLGGTLLVQGLAGSDSIDITTTGAGSDTIRVTVNGTTEDFIREDVKQIVIARNGGSDSVTVASTLQSIAREVNFVVSSNEDAVDTGSLTDEFVDLDPVVPGNQVSLRAAVQNANANSGASSIYVPRSPNPYLLKLTSGSETSNGVDIAVNDLDITTEVAVIVAGPGLSVVDASGLGDDGAANDLNDRIFHVRWATGDLTLSGLTLTGGSVGGGADGGAIRADANTMLNISDAAFVNNQSREGSATGGALRIDGDATITRSVFTDNTADTTGGAIFAFNTTNVTVGSSVFALNMANNSYQNINKGSTVQSIGDNLADADGPDDVFDHATDSVLAAPDYVVTSVGDTFEHGDDLYSLSLRETVDLANMSANPDDVIWAPGWNFRLTRAYDFALFGAEDQDISVGDLDITSDSITVRGILGHTDIAWRAGVIDKVFELAGDYNNDLVVDIADYTVWRDSLGASGDNLAGDGNEDGVVDGADYTLWKAQFGERLTLASLTAAGIDYDASGVAI